MPLPRLLLATNNAKKALELQMICADRFTVITASALPHPVEVEEDAPDFAGNALKKALGFAASLRNSDIAVVVADDSGLCVDALGGLPGVRSARFAADHGVDVAVGAVDEANNDLLLAKLAGLEGARRAAAFACAVVAVRSDGTVLATAEGRVQGQIAERRAGDGGFGYDPLFVVDDPQAGALNGRRMAELTGAEKQSISHRGRAIRRLLAQL